MKPQLISSLIFLSLIRAKIYTLLTEFHMISTAMPDNFLLLPLPFHSSISLLHLPCGRHHTWSLWAGSVLFSPETYISKSFPPLVKVTFSMGPTITFLKFRTHSFPLFFSGKLYVRPRALQMLGGHFMDLYPQSQPCCHSALSSHVAFTLLVGCRLSSLHTGV